MADRFDTHGLHNATPTAPMAGRLAWPGQALGRVGRACEMASPHARPIGPAESPTVDVSTSHDRAGHQSSTLWRRVAAHVLDAVALAVTAGIDIPHDEEITQAGEPDRIADPARARARFAAP